MPSPPSTPPAAPLPAPRPLRPADVLHTWWPLAASWLLMGVEMPMIAAVVSRLAEPEIHLAALGGVVFPLALVIEAPVIMMLAASTALSTDMPSLRRLKRFMVRLAMGLTLVQAIIAFTPLFDWIAIRLIGAPAEIIEPARLGLRLMLPWTWAIADRRFHQGILIRLGQQKQIGVGTAGRLIGTATVLAVGLTTERFSGIAVAATAFSTGVLVEMAYTRWCIRAAGMESIAHAPPPAEPLTTGRMLRFYVPLALTPLLALLSQPIGAAGISRMPLALESLAVWPVLNGLGFLLRTTGVAYNEVVVRHAGAPDGVRVLSRLGWRLGFLASGAIVLIAATPLSTWWFADVSALPPDLVGVARAGLWWAAALPLLSYLHSLYQGILVHRRRTRGITEAVALSLLVTTTVLAAGVVFRPLPGASAAMAALTTGSAVQAAWLWWRCRTPALPPPVSVRTNTGSG